MDDDLTPNKLEANGTNDETMKLNNVVTAMYRYNEEAEALVEIQTTN